MRVFALGRLMLIGLSLLLAGCATFDAQLERGRSLAGVRRYFVVSNPNDNHAFDQQIVATLRARGLTAEAGPLTMMPDDTQAVLTFQDRWTWDFSDHLVFLKINVRDPNSNQPYAIVTFDAQIPLSLTPSEIINKLADRLFAAQAPKR